MVSALHRLLISSYSSDDQLFRKVIIVEILSDNLGDRFHLLLTNPGQLLGSITWEVAI